MIIGVNWMIALPEYCLAVPANRIGHVSNGGPFTTPQLKILIEAIGLTVFLLFSIVYLKSRCLRRWLKNCSSAHAKASAIRPSVITSRISDVRERSGTPGSDHWQ